MEMPLQRRMELLRNTISNVAYRGLAEEVIRDLYSLSWRMNELSHARKPEKANEIFYVEFPGEK